MSAIRCLVDLGGDGWDQFEEAALPCTAAGHVPVVYSWKAYTPAPSFGHPVVGLVLAAVSLPAGANGTQAQGSFNVANPDPAHFLPFPEWVAGQGGALSSAAVLCYGADKAHMFSSHASEGLLAKRSAAPAYGQ
eukprot:gene6872-6550_t